MRRDFNGRPQWILAPFKICAPFSNSPAAVAGPLELTVNVVVAVVLLSVTVITQAALPVVSVEVADVFDPTVGVDNESPEQFPPLRENSVLAVSELHKVFVPVKVTLGVVLTVPDVGEIESAAATTATVVLIESVVSVTVQVPVLPPVVTVTAWLVLLVFDVLT